MKRAAGKARAHWLQRIGWLVGLWLLGVAAVGAMAMLLRWLMRLSWYSI